MRPLTSTVPCSATILNLPRCLGSTLVTDSSTSGLTALTLGISSMPPVTDPPAAAYAAIPAATAPAAAAGTMCACPADVGDSMRPVVLLRRMDRSGTVPPEMDGPLAVMELMLLAAEVVAREGCIVMLGCMLEVDRLGIGCSDTSKRPWGWHKAKDSGGTTAAMGREASGCLCYSPGRAWCLRSCCCTGGGGQLTFFCFVTAVGVVAAPRLPPTLPSRLSAAAGLMPPPGDGGGASPGAVLLRTDCSSGSPDCPDRSTDNAAARQHTRQGTGQEPIEPLVSTRARQARASVGQQQPSASYSTARARARAVEEEQCQSTQPRKDQDDFAQRGQPPHLRTGPRC